jgi:LysM repeat protein
VYHEINTMKDSNTIMQKEVWTKDNYCDTSASQLSEYGANNLLLPPLTEPLQRPSTPVRVSEPWMRLLKHPRQAMSFNLCSRNSKNTVRVQDKNKKGASQKKQTPVETKPSAMPTFQENEAQQGQKLAIVQERKAMDGHQSQAEAIAVKTTAATANLNLNCHINSPVLEAEEQKVKEKAGNTRMAKIDDIALVPDRGTGAEVESEGAMDPPPGRPRDRGRLRICIRLQLIHQSQCLSRTCNHAHLVVS